jgi:hypothetical protein
MQRTLLNLLVDLATAVVMLGMVLTGYVIQFALPPGTNKSWMLWGLTRHEWGQIHVWIATGVLSLILLHVCLHWTWIVTVIRQRLGLPKASHSGVFPDAVLACLTLAAVLGGFAWIAHMAVGPVPDSHTGTCQEDESRERKTQNYQPESPSTDERKLTWRDVYPILEKACLDCHGPQKQRADFRVDQVEKLFASKGMTGWIIPGKSAESPLVDIVSGERAIAMPSRHRLPNGDVARIRKWIDSGAEVSESKTEAR